MSPPQGIRHQWSLLSLSCLMSQAPRSGGNELPDFCPPALKLSVVSPDYRMKFSPLGLASGALPTSLQPDWPLPLLQVPNPKPGWSLLYFTESE